MNIVISVKNESGGDKDNGGAPRTEPLAELRTPRRGDLSG